ncbi:hypothetical protein, partial [Bellilinea sp.]
KHKDKKHPYHKPAITSGWFHDSTPEHINNIKQPKYSQGCKKKKRFPTPNFLNLERYNEKCL